MSTLADPISVLIVGAGPAGLATGACLKQHGVSAVIFEAGADLGTTWRALYDRLHLHTVKALSGLPGMPIGTRYPQYLTRAQVVEYLTAYARHFALDIKTNAPVTHAAPANDGWHVTTPPGEYQARILVSTTGIFSNPTTASFSDLERFQGQILSANSYKEGTPFKGQRVLVIGAGNTGAEIAVDLAEHGAQPTIAIRAGANVVPRDLLGIPIQRWAHLTTMLPRPVMQVLAPVLTRRSAQRQARAGIPRPAQSLLEKPGVPIIGLELLEHARQGTIKVAGAIDHFTETGVQFTDITTADFDVVIMAIGYRPALAYLNGAVTLDAAGRPLRDGVRSSEYPNLFFVGMNYDIRGTLFNIAQEAPQAAKLIAASLTRSVS